MALIAPADLAATAVSSSRINLSWTNDSTPYATMTVQRSVGGGAYSNLAVIGYADTSYADTSCQDGTAYSYKLKVTSGSGAVAYSNTDGDTTSLDAPSGLSGSATSTTVVLTWADPCQNESGFKVYKNGVYLAAVGANVVTYTATGLTAGTWYEFYVKAYNASVTSSASNTERILTADPPTKPSGLTATVTGTTTGTLNWTDNSDNETSFKVERSATSASAGFSQIGTVAANVTTYADTGLTSNTQYWYRVRAYNASGNSAYCTVATMVTLAAIAAPTNLTATALSDTKVDIRFDDNSSLEDDHRLERKTGLGAYAEVQTLLPNRTFIRDTGLSAGTAYTYKVRAKQGGSYSSYSDEVTVTTLSVPAAPTGLAVSEYQDTWLRLTWTKSSGETGYKIAQSTPDEAAYAVIATIDAGIESFKVTGLTAGTKYYFKVLAYNGAGDGLYCASINQTTRAAYSPSKFEKLLKRSKPNLIYLVEANPMMQLSGWTLVTTYSYSTPFDERGAVIDAVYANGTKLTARTTAADVETYTYSWYHDTANNLVYVNADGTDVGDFTVLASFWLYSTNWQTGSTIFNTNYYLPLVAEIPDITQELQEYYGDNLIVTSGTVSFINGKINKQFYFDQRFEKYLWINRKVKILAGGAGFTYSEFEAINTGIVNGVSITDQRFTLDLRDYRDGLHKILPAEKYSIDTFPLMSTDTQDLVRPFGFGTITNAVPTCIDTTNRVFEFHNGPCKSVTAVKQNGTTLSENTDFFVDYGLGRITLARGLTYSTSDIILVDFHGWTNSADEEISNPADVFKKILNYYMDISDSDLDLDSIYATKYVHTTALSLYIWKETGSQDIIRRIEQSTRAHSIQDSDGRIGFRALQTTAPSDIKYIPSEWVFDFEMVKNQDPLFSAVEFSYNENPSADQFSLLTKTNLQAVYKYGIAKTLPITVALASSSNVDTLATAVLADLENFPFSFSVPRSLFYNFPGDLIYFTRTRFPALSGTAANLLVRIISITKQFSSGRTQITAREL